MHVWYVYMLQCAVRKGCAYLGASLLSHTVGGKAVVTSMKTPSTGCPTRWQPLCPSWWVGLFLSGGKLQDLPIPGEASGLNAAQWEFGWSVHWGGRERERTKDVRAQSSQSSQTSKGLSLWEKLVGFLRRCGHRSGSQAFLDSSSGC